LLPRVHSEFSIFFVNLLWIHYMLGWFTLKPIITFANSLWIKCIHYLLREFTMAQLIFPILTLNLLILSPIYSQSIIFFANPLWIHYLFREFTRKSLFFREFTIFFANSLWLHYFFAYWLWIHYLFREFTRDSVFFRKFTLNLLSLSRIHYLFREFTGDSLFFANSLWI